MIVFRIARTKHAHDLTGEGARLNGGRWNHKLTPCIYAPESRALTLLEYSVNVSIDDIPGSMSITTIEIPDNILQPVVNALPRNWRDSPAPSTAKDFGTGLLTAATHPVIKLPSAIIPEEFNYILNPLHKDSKAFKIIAVSDFVYEMRIKGM